MSRDNTEKRKRTQEEKKKLTVRVIAVIMVVLMILGAASYTITILASAVNAAETDTIDTSSLKQSGDVLITVGLMVGDETPSSLEVTSEAGFVLGSQQMDGDRDFRTVWELENRKITLAPAANLSSDGAGFEVASSERTTDLGGYRIEVNCADCDRYDLEDLVYDIERSARRMGFSVTPAYVHGQFALRLGAYTSWEDAYDDLEDAEDLFPDRRVSVVGPSTTGVSVIDPSTYEVIFEFDCDGGLELGVGAEEDRNGNTYVKVPAGNIYDGVLAFRRAPEGVAVINVVPLESYIAGVLPYETSNEWPLETQKAFAVTVRSFTLSYCGEKGKHKSLGYDLCPEVCCQVYRGAGRINDKLMKAVLGTAGLVMTYDRNIVEGYYSSSVGGVTVNAEDAWNGTKPVPYLKAVETPWENYMNHENAFWITEISPTALLDRFRQAGYSELRGSVEKVEIAALAKNSTYIKTLKVTDSYGTEITIDTTDSVRIALTPYVKSSNFVIGKGKVEYTEDIVIPEAVPDTSGSEEEAGKIEEIPEGPLGMDYSYTDLDEFVVITKDSLEKSYFKNSVLLMSGEGYADYFRHDIFAVTAENAAAFLGEEYDELYGKGVAESRTDAMRAAQDRAKQEKVKEEETRVSEDGKTAYKTAYAEDRDNFIIVGKGWGHGVGMSQWGAYELGLKGYTAKEILDAYFTDIDVMDYLDTNQY